MKEIDELNERIDGQDEIIDSLIKNNRPGEAGAKTVDYTLHFEALQKIFEMFLLRYNKENGELKAAIGQLNISYPAEQIQNTLSEVKTILEAVRKSLPVKVKHEFDPKTKGWIIAGMILLIVTAISSGLSGYLWTENNCLHGVDIKYRLLWQVDESSTKWADSIYTRNPDEAEKTVIRMENAKIMKDKANDTQNSKRGKKSRKRPQ